MDNEDLTNDNTYSCEQCDESCKCFTTGGSTNFCPVCGNRF